MQAQDGRFSATQRRVLWGMIVAYTAAYVCRLNLSAALSSLSSGLGIGMEQCGMLPTAFAVVYALGQFVNGAIVNRVHPVRHMLLGLTGSGVCNALMWLVACFPNRGSFPLMLTLCVLNGGFQSMLWTPIVRLLALEFTTDTQRKRVNFQLAFTMTAGHFLAWLISWLMVNRVSWSFSFLVPALVMLPAILATHLLLRDVESIGKAEMVEKVASKSMHAESPWGRLAATGFPLVLAGCVLHGFVRDGIINWAPAILSGLSSSSIIFSLVIPLINAAGIVAGHVLVSRGEGSPRKTCGLLFAFGAVMCLLLIPFRSFSLILALAMGMGCAAMYGMNPLMTTLIPLEYDRWSMSAITAGMVDSFIYIGSALSGAVGGSFFAISPSILFFALAAASAAGAAVMWASARRK